MKKKMYHSLQILTIFQQPKDELISKLLTVQIFLKCLEKKLFRCKIRLFFWLSVILVQELEKVVMLDLEAVTPIQEDIAGCQFVTRQNRLSSDTQWFVILEISEITTGCHQQTFR